MAITKTKMNNINQKKYEECLEILKEMHEIILLAISMTSSKDVAKMDAVEIIKATIQDIEILNSMTEEDKIKLDKELGLNLLDNHDKNEVVVYIDEDSTKDIIQ